MNDRHRIAISLHLHSESYEAQTTDLHSSRDDRAARSVLHFLQVLASAFPFLLFIRYSYLQLLNGWGSRFFSSFLGLLSGLRIFRQVPQTCPGIKEEVVTSAEDAPKEASGADVV
jgi:hypothetical protein